MTVTTTQLTETNRPHRRFTVMSKNGKTDCDAKVSRTNAANNRPGLGQATPSRPPTGNETDAQLWSIDQIDGIAQRMHMAHGSIEGSYHVVQRRGQ